MATGPAAPRRRKTPGEGWGAGGTMGTASRAEERRGTRRTRESGCGRSECRGVFSVEQDVGVTAQIVFEVALERVHDGGWGGLV